MLKDGVIATIVFIVYSIPVILIGFVFVAGVGAIPMEGELPSGNGQFLIGTILIGGLLMFGTLFLVTVFVYPAAIGLYAKKDTAVDAFAIPTMIRVIFTPSFLIAVVIGGVIASIGFIASLMFSLPFIGVVLAPLIAAPVGILTHRIYGMGVKESIADV